MMITKKILITFVLLLSAAYFDISYSANPIPIKHWIRVNDTALSVDARVEALTVFKNKLYAAGSDNEHHLFVSLFGGDNEKPTWLSVSNLEIHESIGNSETSLKTLAVIKDRLYGTGQIDIINFSPPLILTYDDNRSSWADFSTKNLSNVSIKQFFSFDGKLYLLAENSLPSSFIYVYDESKQSWILVSNGFFNSDIIETTAILNNKLYVAGAGFVKGRKVPVVYVYNAKDNSPTWTSVKADFPVVNMTGASAGIKTLFVYRNILFAGGQDPDYKAFVYVYNGNDIKPVWTDVRKGLKTVCNEQNWYGSHVDKLNIFNGNLYAAGEDACGHLFVDVYNGNNQARSWQFVGNGLPNIPSPLKVSGLIEFNHVLYVSGYHNLRSYGEDGATFIYALTEEKKQVVSPKS